MKSPFKGCSTVCVGDSLLPIAVDAMDNPLEE